MYERFKRGLLKPREIGIYLKDSWRKVWLYFFLLSTILLLPVIVIETTYEGMSSQELSAINRNFQGSLSGNYSIIDGVLTVPDDFSANRYLNLGYYSINIINAPLNFENLVTLNFEETGIQMMFFNAPGGYLTYKEIGLDNFDFNDYSIENKIKFGNAINKFIVSYNFETKTLYILFVLLATVFDLLLMIFIAAFFGPVGFPFKLKFKMGVYASTVYVITVLFANLFNIEYLVYFGMILLIIYMKKAFTSIIMR